MEDIPMNEQWKLDGDCRICRRAKYCTKGCKKQRIADERFIQALTIKAFAKALLKQGNKEGDSNE